MKNRLLTPAAAYVKSMRPYTFFVTGTAGVLGLLLAPGQTEAWRTAVILILLFSSYGINQVINDLLGMKEDRYNAPARPLVSGQISVKLAITITVILFLAGAAATYFLNPQALAVYFLAYLMNIIYEQFKGIPFLGNAWFGVMIALAPVFGYMAAGNLSLSAGLSDANLVYLAILVAASSSALCYYTYFKDYEGDKIAGKKTIIVAMGPLKARYLNLPMSILPFLLLLVFLVSGSLLLSVNPVFFVLLAASFVFCLYAATYCFKNPGQSKKALELNFECTPLFLSALIALFDPGLGLFLFAGSFAAMKFFYWLMYRNIFY